MKTAAALTLLGVLLAPAQSGASPNWTLEHARHVLTTRTFAATDKSQPDRPDYELVFSRLAAKSLRKGFVFAGLAHDALTDADVRVRFTFKRPGRITAFRGPPADTAQPVFPIHAAFYYAPPDRPVPNWPPYDGLYPRPPSYQ